MDTQRTLRSKVPRLVLLTLICTSFVMAQRPGGKLEGRIVDASTQDPLIGANILLVGTTLGTSTDANGTYTIDIPAGDYVVQYRFLGYSSQNRSISIEVGRTATEDVALRQDILEFDEVVVTGTGGLPATKARLGNSISTLRTEDLEKVPVRTITEAFDGRTTGVQVLNSNGLAGVGSLIQLRGANSLTGNIQPLIIVDGVRFSQLDSYNDASASSWDGRGGPSVSTLNMLNAGDIDRVEILKGPSASVLYGSDAANGVIQIFTKSGAGLAPGVTRYTYSSEYALADWSLYDSKLNRAARQVLDASSRGTSSNQLSVTGAGPQYRFYTSARALNTNIGFLSSNNQNLDVKGNFTYTITPEHQLKVHGGYTRDNTVKPETDNSTWSPWFQTLFKHDSVDAYAEWRNPYDGRTYVSISEFDKFKNTYRNNRYSGGVEYTAKLPYQLNFETRVGYENLDLMQTVEINSGFRLFRSGYRSQDQQSVTAYNMQSILSGTYRLSEGIGLDMSVGLDFYRRKRDFINANSFQFAPGADRRIDDGDPTSYDISEIHQLFSSGSVFSQAQFDLWNRFYVTLGGRLDKSSSFGKEASSQFYPKASASYLLPVEGVVSFLSLAKVRGTYGEAGLQPPIGAAELEYRKDDLNGDIQAFYIRRPGNPDLKPAVSKEYEGGLDLAFFENRLGIEATYYYQTTYNDVFTVATKPSDGYGNRLQDYNLGSVQTKGWEVSVFGVPYQSGDLRWYSRLNVTTYDNVVLDDGGFAYNSTPFGNLYILRIEEGHSVPELFVQTQVFDEYGNMSVGPATYRGKVVPTLTGNFLTDVTLFSNLSLTVNFVGATGHKIFNLTKETRRRAGIFDDEFTKSDWDAYVDAASVDGPNRSPEQIAAIVKFFRLTNRFSDEMIEDGSYIKLREISLRYTLPRDWSGAVGFNDISLSVAARNVFTITNYEGFDPEVSVGGSSVIHRGADSQSVPNPRTFSFGAHFTL